jgi:hypothetical protein
MAKDGAAAQGAKALPKKAPVGLLAARRAFDIVGSLLLGSLTGLGGGVVRDLIIGVTPTPFHPAGVPGPAGGRCTAGLLFRTPCPAVPADTADL